MSNIDLGGPVVISGPVVIATPNDGGPTAGPIATTTPPGSMSGGNADGTAATAILFGQAGTTGQQFAMPTGAANGTGIPGGVGTVYPPGVYPS